MTFNQHTYKKGFSLIEMLLVMVVVSSIIVMATSYMARKAETQRIDQTVLKMQYVLNAGLAYYVASANGQTSGGEWPGSNDLYYELKGPGSNSLQPNFLGSAPILDMAANPMWITHRTNATGGPPNTFQVLACVPGTSTKSATNAKIIVGKLPLGFTMQNTALNCSTTLAVGYVLMPSQVINQAMSMKFAGVYHHGACVPVPMCPDKAAGAGVTMTPQIFVVPLSVSGLNGNGNTNIYPISSFTTFATPYSTNPSACSTYSTVSPACSNGNSNELYWRVCLQLITERGDVQQSGSTNWGDNVNLAAFTRCQISNEPSGSGFTVYGN
jgi:prepilin-type N-terminal cleavage/methylation domain-containing protein